MDSGVGRLWLQIFSFSLVNVSPWTGYSLDFRFPCDVVISPASSGCEGEINMYINTKYTY